MAASMKNGTETETCFLVKNVDMVKAMGQKTKDTVRVRNGGVGSNPTAATMSRRSESSFARLEEAGSIGWLTD